MTRETEWRAEWETLCAERAAARSEWCSAADGLAARVHDPLGLGKLLPLHPAVAGGVGAAVAALLVKMFLGRAGKTRSASPDEDAVRPASTWSTVLRDAVTSVAVPWLLRMLKEKFGVHADTVAAPPAAPEAAHVAGGVSPHRPG